MIIISITESYANDLVFDDESKTIRELKENIEELDKNKDELIIKSKDFSPDSLLKSYFRDDLNSKDLTNLKVIIDDYNKDRRRLELELNKLSKELKTTTNIKIKLLEEKKDLYKRLTPFIKVDNYKDYLKYIKADTSLYSEKKEIDSDIIRKQEIINNKVEVLEERIKRHKSYLEDNLRMLVEKKLEEKISQLSENPWFASLTTENKIKVLNKTILKIQWRIDTIKEINTITESWIYSWSSNEKKIEIYNITLEKLREFKLTFEK